MTYLNELSPRVTIYVTYLNEFTGNGSPSVSIGTLKAALWHGSRARLQPIGVDRGPGAALRCGSRAWGAPHPAWIAGAEAALEGWIANTDAALRSESRAGWLPFHAGSRP